jgi:hypothetical protein
VRDAAHVRGGDESREIPDNSTTDGDDRGIAPKPRFEQFVG